MKLNEELAAQLLKERLSRTEQVLGIKAKEYVRNEDMMHNFNVGAKRKDIIRERIIEAFSLKHEISIEDMLCDMEKGIAPKEEVVIEKFGDAINYLILKEMSILHKIKENGNN